MPGDVREQRKCYFASDDYSESFWGKYIYLYEGKGRLRLTTSSLCLEDCSGAVEIPFNAIESIRLSRFSSLAKPTGLSRLTVCFEQDGESRTIHLVPYESVFNPVWVTSELVASWHETLSRVAELSARVQPIEVRPEPQNFATAWLLVAVCLVLPLVVAGVVIWGID